MLTWNYRCCATDCCAKVMDLKKLPPGWGSIFVSITVQGPAPDDTGVEGDTLYFCPDHITADAVTGPLDAMLKKTRIEIDEQVRERRRSPKWKQPRPLDDDEG